MPIKDYGWIALAITVISWGWAWQSWRRQKAAKPKHIPVWMAIGGVALGFAVITLTGFDVWSWSILAILAWVVIMLLLAGSLFWDIFKSEGPGGHDGHHTKTPVFACVLAVMVMLSVGHSAVTAINDGVNTVKTTPTVTDLVHSAKHNHGG